MTLSSNHSNKNSAPPTIDQSNCGPVQVYPIYLGHGWFSWDGGLQGLWAAYVTSGLLCPTWLGWNSAGTYQVRRPAHNNMTA